MVVCSPLEVYRLHLKSTFDGNRFDDPLPTISLSPEFPAKAPRLLLDLSNTFQKRSVSSPAPVTID